MTKLPIVIVVVIAQLFGNGYDLHRFDLLHFELGTAVAHPAAHFANIILSRVFYKLDTFLTALI